MLSVSEVKHTTNHNILMHSGVVLEKILGEQEIFGGPCPPKPIEHEATGINLLGEMKYLGGAQEIFGGLKNPWKTSKKLKICDVISEMPLDQLT